MSKLLFLLIFFINLSAWSQTSTIMHPFDQCPSLEVRYEKVVDKNKEFFRVSFTEANKEIKTFEVDNIKSIIEKNREGLNDKDVSLLDHLKRRAEELCPLKRDSRGVYCETRSYLITPEFELFMTQVTEHLIKNDQDICEEIPDFAILQAEVEGLDDQKILQFKKSRHWAKLFKNVGNKKSIKEKYRKIFQGVLGTTWKKKWKEFWPKFEENKLHDEMEINTNYTSSLIDAWVACGGKKNDGLFLKNLIKLSAVESCLAPKPPGSISSEELEVLSTEIAEKNKNKTLLGTFLNREAVMMEAIKELAKKSVRNSVYESFGEIISPDATTRQAKVDEFVNNLDAIKNLMNIESDSDMAKVLPDYATYVFSPNVKMEIGEKILPFLVDNLVSDYIKNENKEEVVKRVKSKAIENFKDCKVMNSHFSMLNEKESFQLSYRMLYYRNFCSKPENLSKCQSSCQGPSYLEESELKSDEDVVKLCIVYSLAASSTGVDIGIPFGGKEFILKIQPDK